MAKLSDRQKNNIKAKWDTGEYTKTQLGKLYKISDVMVGKIVGKEEPKNSHFVEAQVMLEEAKKLEKSSTEIAAINQAVEYRLKVKHSDDNKRVKVYDITDRILDKVSGLLNKGTKQVVVKVKEYSKENGSSESLDAIEQELDPNDLKNLQDTVDKASITNNTNLRHSNQQINVNAQTNVQVPISIEWE